MALNGNTQMPIGVVGLWHLGCTIAACWAKHGHRVRAVDSSEEVVRGLYNGHPPIYEPGLDKAIRSGINAGRLTFSTSVASLRGCRFVFVAHDTPVRGDDTSDLTIIENTFASMGAHFDPGAIVIVSAQLPVGSCSVLRSRLKQVHPTIELVYSPENLRLGEALACYTSPGHIVIGADDEGAAKAVEDLFAPMEATCLKMNLPSAEMTKHAINSFLAASITLSNQWADLCEVVGADFSQVAEAMRHDPRIGKRAYLAAGIGFSGGTLGRDLQALEQVNRQKAGNAAPIFGDIWRYNRSRAQVVRSRCEKALGTLQGRTIALLGMTYKPGTSTLRRSLPLEVAEDLGKHGALLRAHDPKANWAEVVLPPNLSIHATPYEAIRGAHLAVLLTEWPEFLAVDYERIKVQMAQPILFDTKNMLRGRHDELARLGFKILAIGRS